ncbi:MAG: AraC family transcriptional regulator ligand-binding domain-containing protein [Myxococcus sp.]|nr:AraC family transcriptional regulator ligand-binding domain-containing protein [Myxococcus sp.]
MAALRARRFTSALVPWVLGYVRAHGEDARGLEKKYLHVRTADGIATPEVSLDELGTLLADAAKLLGDPLFGLHAATAMGRGAYGLLEFGLRSAPTGREAIEQLAKYGALINPLVRWSLEVDGDEVSLHHRAPKKGGVGRQGNVFTVCRIVRIAREMMGEDVKPARAWFAHDEKACPPELLAFLGTTEVAFGRASNGVSFRSETLARPTAEADAELNRALEQHGKAVLKSCGDLDDAYERVRGAVIELLPHGKATLAGAARRLHVTPRTLQRRLAEHGLSFAALLNEVRRAQSERLLLRSDAPLHEVAEQVGYRDAATFVRAFRGWTGTTPGRFRDAR